MPEPGKGAVCKTAALCSYTVGGSSPPLSAKLLERPNLPRQLARLVPIWTLALWADSRLSDCSFTGNPAVTAAITFIPLLGDVDHAHVSEVIPESNILSSLIFILTSIYLISNILLR